MNIVPAVPFLLFFLLQRLVSKTDGDVYRPNKFSIEIDYPNETF